MFESIKRLFRKSRPKAFESVQTTPLTEEQLQAITQTSITLNPPQLLVGSAQSVGKQRDHNEDTLFSLTATIAEGHHDLPFGIFIIADGMGGHQHGEVASLMATRAMSDYLIKQVYFPLMGLGSETQIDSLHEIMAKGVSKAQKAVLENAPGGGTTLTAALIIGERVTIAHVGDSRAYFLYNDGRMQAVTMDHSLVRRLIELGQLTKEEAAVHPQRNVLYRALGQNEPFEAEINTMVFPNSGYLLLCSDGLWGVVPEAEIFRIVMNAENLSLACHRLVEAANAAGGPDNISVVLVQYLD